MHGACSRCLTRAHTVSMLSTTDVDRFLWELYAMHFLSRYVSSLFVCVVVTIAPFRLVVRFGFPFSPLSRNVSVSTEVLFMRFYYIMSSNKWLKDDMASVSRIVVRHMNYVHLYTHTHTPRTRLLQDAIALGCTKRGGAERQ